MNKTASGANVDIHNLDKDETYEEMLALSFETNENRAEKAGNLFRGWFIPPATTKYRFY